MQIQNHDQLSQSEHALPPPSCIGGRCCANSRALPARGRAGLRSTLGKIQTAHLRSMYPALTWWNWLRMPPLSVITFGQEIAMPCLTPPRCETICLVHENGVSKAHAHGTAMWL